MSWAPVKDFESRPAHSAPWLSGQSLFSAAGAEILRRFTERDARGEPVAIDAGSSSIGPGLTPTSPVALSWKTFTEASDQAGMSPIWRHPFRSRRSGRPSIGPSGCQRSLEAIPCIHARKIAIRIEQIATPRQVKPKNRIQDTNRGPANRTPRHFNSDFHSFLFRPKF